MEISTLPQLERDVRGAVTSLGAGEARTLVDLYYGLQDFRIQASNQNRALTKSEEPHETIAFFFGAFYRLERDIAKALDTYSDSQPLGAWARQHVGVGPVIAAGLLAHIPIERTPTPSALWKFAGLAPGQRYVKGEKRSWNAGLKVLCWKLGDSFVKQSGRENCYYGHLYRQRKEKEIARNDAVVETDTTHGYPAGEVVAIPISSGNTRYFRGGNARAAQQSLDERNIRDAELKRILQSGKLPDGQLDQRARRYAVKRFLVHYWQAAWILHYGSEPPRAYVFDQLAHVDEEPCPVPMPQPKPQ